MTEKNKQINTLDDVLDHIGDEWEILVPATMTSYNDGRCSEYIESSKEGKSFIEIAADMNINRSTFVAWAKSHPAFAHALLIGDQYFIAYWEKTFRELANGESKGNAQAAIFYTKNRLPRIFRDKLEVSHSSGGGIQVITNVPEQAIAANSPFSLDIEIEEAELVDSPNINSLDIL